MRRSETDADILSANERLHERTQNFLLLFEHERQSFKHAGENSAGSAPDDKIFGLFVPHSALPARRPAGVHRFHAGRFKTLIICRVKNSLHPYAYVIKQSRYTDLQIHSDLNRALPPQYLLKKVFPFLF